MRQGRLLCFAAIIMASTACESTVQTKQVEAFGGALAFEVPAQATEFQQDGRIRWEASDLPYVVTAQRIPIEWNGPERTPRSVAESLRRRYQLGEAIGGLQIEDDIVAGRSAVRLDGWIARTARSRRSIRTGFVVASGKDIFLVEAIASSDESRVAVNTAIRLARQSLSLR